MSATVLNEQGKAEVMFMGCYGIGVSRVVAAAIEQNHDDNGIKWPTAMAPFTVVIAPLNMQKAPEVAAKAEELYKQLQAQGVEVLLDDRNMRPGAMFADQELLGIPHRIVVSERGLQAGELEYKARQGGDAEKVPMTEILPFIMAKLSSF
jgi:prolyl-tRNA synthetase